MPYFGDNPSKTSRPSSSCGHSATHSQLSQRKLTMDFSGFDKVPGEVEPQVLGEAEELVVIYLSEQYERDGYLHSKVCSALSTVLKVSVSEIEKALQRVKDSPWYRQHLK